MTYQCYCPSCVGQMTGTCVICWEHPFGAEDADGVKWDICIGCMIKENMPGATWPG